MATTNSNDILVFTFLNGRELVVRETDIVQQLRSYGRVFHTEAKDIYIRDNLVEYGKVYSIHRLVVSFSGTTTTFPQMSKKRNRLRRFETPMDPRTFAPVEIVP